MITAQEIREKKFEKAAWGYQSEEVEEYLARLEEEVQEFENEREDSNHKIQVLADKVREYMKDEEAIKDALLDAQKNGHRVIAEANAKAELILSRAKEEAAMLLDEATRQHEIAMEKNRAEIAKEKEALAEAKKRVADFKRSLYDMYKTHIDMISSIPEENEELPPPSPETANLEVDEAKEAILAAAMAASSSSSPAESTLSFTPPSPEDFD